MRKLLIKDSTSISNAWYDTNTSSLRVEFKSGCTYTYLDVTLDIIEKWQTLSALPKGSVGSQFHGLIKMGGFKYSKVGE